MLYAFRWQRTLKQKTWENEEASKIVYYRINKFTLLLSEWFYDILTLSCLWKLRNYLNSNRSKIVLIAIQDEGSKHISPAIDALKRVGATDDILDLTDHRGSFALVGYAGVDKPTWIAQKSAKRGKGPSEISLTIPPPTGTSSFHKFPEVTVQCLSSAGRLILNRAVVSGYDMRFSRLRGSFNILTLIFTLISRSSDKKRIALVSRSILRWRALAHHNNLTLRMKAVFHT